MGNISRLPKFCEMFGKLYLPGWDHLHDRRQDRHGYVRNTTMKNLSSTGPNLQAGHGYRDQTDHRQHPGGIMVVPATSQFFSVQHPADDNATDIITTTSIIIISGRC